MQEEVENRTLTLIVSGTKFTGRLFKAAISKYMAHRREKKLEKQRSNIEINDPSIRDFERIARKYGVDYAVKKDRSASPPKYLIFFKARDADALTAAFSEYTQKKVKKVRAGEAGPVQGVAQKYRGGPQPPEGAGTMKQLNLKKLVLLNLPYFLLGLFATNLGEAWRLATGADASAKMLSFFSTLPVALGSWWPSLHPLDLAVGICCGAGLRLAVYLKGKTATTWSMVRPVGAPMRILPPTSTRCSRITSF